MTTPATQPEMTAEDVVALRNGERFKALSIEECVARIIKRSNEANLKALGIKTEFTAHRLDKWIEICCATYAAPIVADLQTRLDAALAENVRLCDALQKILECKITRNDQQSEWSQIVLMIAEIQGIARCELAKRDEAGGTP